MSSNVHGRKRENVSEEALLARREREAGKIKAYNELVEQCRSQFEQGIYTPETLSLTTRILQHNPDYYTIWNKRRVILQRGFLESGESLSEEAIAKNRSIYVDDLQFFMQLIRINPKSYWLWNHRRWCLESMPNPDWMAELGLVEKLLAMDARNFHGWDYRRYVVEKLRQEAKDEEQVAKLTQGEFDFTTRKIKQSFSNYSAWHQRTRLLPETVASMSPEEKNQVAKHELELIEAAIYTDPDDQSAWLYYRWVVGRALLPVRILGAYRCEGSRAIIVVMDSDVILSDVPCLLDDNDKPVSASWMSLGPNQQHGIVWIAMPDSQVNPSRINIHPDIIVPNTPLKSKPASAWQGEIKSIPYASEINALIARFETSTTHWSKPSQQPYIMNNPSHISAWHTLDRVQLLKDQVRVVRDLLDLEPESKWVLQTLAHFLDQLRLANGVEDPEKTCQEIVSIYETLTTIDPYRMGRYQDAKQKVLLESHMDALIKSNGVEELWRVIEHVQHMT
ncbi:hypothetical protein LRAMOSA04880 [Lichtheimia ramosa]|uniref:Geranylgeranyl transferase type-2 subunit alpha n=1 Tax=Lichtheimia ramosa TaxID=688394 RepID=A0A077WZP3_9FUNG|nr:hypothetical protein LRAMOSA04880 [Lichtheimia ramosa]